MELQYLHIFHESARCGSFSAAAKSLKITQPSVTRAVQSLESSLGVKLFRRQARGVTLTDEGKQVFERSIKIFRECKAIEDLKSPLSRPLRAAASDNLCIHVLPQVLAKTPELGLTTRLISGTAEEVNRAVINHEADVGYCYHPSKAPGLSCVAIAQVPFWLIVHPALVGAKPTLKSLVGLPLIGSLSRDYSGANAAQILLSELKIEHREPIHQCNNQQAQLAMVCARLGYSLVPWFIAKPQIQKREIIRIPSSRPLLAPLYRITQVGVSRAGHTGYPNYVDEFLDPAIRRLVEKPENT